MSGVRRRVAIQNIDQLPLYGNRRTWMQALGISYSRICLATRSQGLEGDKQGIDIYHSRKQILKWYAPSLYKELYGESTDIGNEQKISTGLST